MAVFTVVTLAFCGGLGRMVSATPPRNVIEKYILPVLGLRRVRCADCFRLSYQPFFVILRERPEAEVTHSAAV
jgi:hypothetical protein